MKSGIYKVTNKCNNKSYIGQSENVYNRLKELKKENLSSTTYLSQEITQYGIENFNFKILELCYPSLLNNKQKYYIEKYNTIYPYGYNKTKGGNGNYK